MGFVSLFSIYVIMVNSAPEEKDNFYKDMEAAINEVPKQYLLYILGSFNTRVGSDSTSWPVCLAQDGIDTLNESGKRYWSFSLHTTSVLPTPSFMSSPFIVYFGGTLGLSIGISLILC